MTNREKVTTIFNDAVAAVHPASLLPLHLSIELDRLYILNQSYSLYNLPGIYVVGAGKASAAMAKSVEDLLGKLVTAGIVVTKYGHSLQLQTIECMEAAHPVPDEQGLAATVATTRLLQQVGPNDIVICLISGGASSLWIDVPPGVTLAAVQETFGLLLKSGANIEEMNKVRKYLSRIKGGQLLQYAPHATWFTFIISDVPGDDLPVIASGPTVPCNTRFNDVKHILDAYNLWGNLPVSIQQYLENSSRETGDESLPETTDPYPIVYNQIVGNNQLALEAAAESAGAMGLVVQPIEYNLAGDAAEVGRDLMHAFKSYKGARPACFLLGGETTVKVTGKGKGGRNQHMALGALLELDNEHNHNITFLSAGTDGTDGPTDAAGAIADHDCLTKAKEKNLDPRKFFHDNDAYHFFEQTEALFKTGPTQTNVMDMVVVIVE